MIENITDIFVHCTGMTIEDLPNAEALHDRHTKLFGWDGLGYHAVISPEGIVTWGRPLFWPGAHVKGHNSTSWGICLIGYKNYPLIQLSSLRDTIRSFKRRWAMHTRFHYDKKGIMITPLEDVPIAVRGHYEVNANKTCPNYMVDLWYKKGTVQYFDNIKPWKDK